jgi:hypothetical protein
VLSMDILEYRQFWDFNLQAITPSNMVISKGDKLNTHCVYDTSKTELPVHFGSASDDEKCLHFLFVYPAEHLTAKYCGRSQGGYSMCSNTIAKDANLICKNNPVPDGMLDIPAELRFGEATNSSADENHRLATAVLDPSSIPQETYDSQLNELTCQLYRFKETSLRNTRLTVALGVTVVLISFCSVFGACIYFCGEYGMNDNFNSIGTKLNEVVISPQRNQYEMVSLEEGKNSLDDSKDE